MRPRSGPNNILIASISKGEVRFLPQRLSKWRQPTGHAATTVMAAKAAGD